MSWFSEFIDDPIEFISDEPWKALGLLAAPIGAIAAPFLLPEMGAAAGLFGAGEAAGGAMLGEGALAGASLEGLAGGAAGGTAASEGLFGGLGLSGFGGEAGGLGSTALGFAGEAPGAASAWSSMGLPELAGEAGSAMAYAPEGAGADMFAGGLPGEAGFGGEAAELGGAPGMPDASYAPSNPTQSPGWASNLWDKAAADPLKAAGIGLSGAGLAYNLASGMGKSPNIEAMQASAGAQSAQAKQLMSYLQKGQLPPGLDGVAKTMKQSMDAQAIANAAKSGMPTDPTQNTSLMNQLAANNDRVFGWIAEQGMKLLNAGVTLSGLSNTLYAQLEALDRQKSQQTGQAIANFAAALNGGGKGTYMKVA